MAGASKVGASSRTPKRLRRKSSFSLGGIFLLLVYTIASLSFPTLAQETVQVGYAVLQSGGSGVPTTSALFAYRNNQGVLISEAAVAAVTPLTKGRILVDQARSLTGVAFANPSDQSIELQLTLRNADGDFQADRGLRLEPHQHLPRFLNDSEFFPDISAGFLGTLTFESGAPGVAAVTLRQGVNLYGEPLFATLPVADLSGFAAVGEAGGSSLVFPHLGAGPTLASQLILINPGGARIRGRIDLFDSGGTALTLDMGEESAASFDFEIAGYGVFLADLTSSGPVLQGYAVVSVTEGPLPVGTLIFRFLNGEQLVSEAAVPATSPSTSAQIFVDTVETQTGLAVACPECAQPEDLQLELYDRHGNLLDTGQLQLPRRGHAAFFVPEYFPNLPPGFTGSLILKSAVPLVAVTLKLTQSARGDPILTTLPLADLNAPLDPQFVVVPQLGFGLGFSTRLLVLGGGLALDSFSLSFFTSSGTPLVLPLAGVEGSVFQRSIAASGAFQLRPGNASTVAQILADALDPSATEVAVNQGFELLLQPLVIDQQGELRDDFEISYTSLDSGVVQVDEQGRLQGISAGFATLTMQAGGGLASTTVVVPEISAGFGGFQVAGVSSDLSGRIYLAGDATHVILSSEDFASEPEIFAGTSNQAGFVDGPRIESLFRNPRFLALDQARGVLYVSDSANHVIRQIGSGSEGVVSTFAGSGLPGSLDGHLSEASFKQPGGLALDNQGNLWIADSGNHLVRRVLLASGIVESVAGAAGVAGTVDGTGAGALFDRPSGITLEVESLAERLEREAQGLPAPEVRVIVAEAGSGLLRRVYGDGRVETISEPVPAFLDGPHPQGADPYFFDVTSDSAGNLFFSAASDVQVFLSDGRRVAAAQPGTFLQPAGIRALGSGRILLAESNQPGKLIRYGGPRIDSIEPMLVAGSGGAEIVISGRNFAPETRVFIEGSNLTPEIQDSLTLNLQLPPLGSGIHTLTVQNRGGLAQAPLTVEPIPLEDLEAGEITTLAGGATFVRDGGAARDATLNNPSEMVLDPIGNLYFSDTFNHRIRRVDPDDKVITTAAGTGIRGFSGDGQVALVGELDTPEDIVIGPSGALYVADSLNRRIRRIDPFSGVMATVAGGGTPLDDLGDGTPALKARIGLPVGIALDGNGNLFIGDAVFHRVRRVDATTGIIETVAGNGTAGFSGDGGLAVEANLNRPEDLLLLDDNTLLIADVNNRRIRQLDMPSGVITSVVGNGCDFSPTCDPSDGTPLGTPLFRPGSMTLDFEGLLLLADESVVYRVNFGEGSIEAFAGPSQSSELGDGGPALGASFVARGLLLDGAANLYIGDVRHQRIRRVAANDGIIETLAGGASGDFLGDGQLAFTATLAIVPGLALDPEQNLWLSDNQRIRRIDGASGIIESVTAGGFGFSGDGGPALEARLGSPKDVLLDEDGNLLFADSLNHRIRRIDGEALTISTIAGGGTPGDGIGDGLLATQASLFFPEGLALDLDQNLLIADRRNDRVRRVDFETGLIETIAGGGGVQLGIGDGGTALDAVLKDPYDIVVNSAGDLFIADNGHYRIRRVDALSGEIETVAGTGNALGLLGDGGPATSARVAQASRLALDDQERLLISDGPRVRRVDLESGIITTIAGGGVDPEGDGGPAPDAYLRADSILLDPAGNLLIGDSGTIARIRIVRAP